MIICKTDATDRRSFLLQPSFTAFSGEPHASSLPFADPLSVAALTLGSSAQAALVGYWSLDGDSDADAGGWGPSTLQSGGNGEADTSFVNDAPTQISGTQSLAFDGNNDDVLVTGFNVDTAGIGAQGPSFTVSYWLKINGDGPPPQRDMVSIGSTQTGGTAASFDFDGSNDIKVFYYNGRASTAGGDGGSGGVLSYNGSNTDWHHLALTYDTTHGSSLLYLDGTQVGVGVGGTSEMNFLSTASLTLGGLWNGTTASRLINDIQLADLAIWDEALDAATVAGLADGSISPVPAIPEPASVALLGIGGVLIGGRRRR